MTAERRPSGGRKSTTTKRKKAGRTAKKSRRAAAPAAPPPAPAVPDRPPATRLHIWQFQAFRDLMFVGAVIVIIWSGYALRAVTVPLLVALLLAYLVEPLIVRLCERPSITRTRAVAGLLTGLCLLLLVLIAFVIPLVVGQTTRFALEVKSGAMRDRVARVVPYVPGVYRDEFISVVELLPGRRDVRGDAPADGAPAGEGPDAAGAAAPAEVVPGVTEEELTRLIDERVERRLDRGGGGPVAAMEETWLDLARGGVHTILGIIGAIVKASLLVFLVPFYFFFFSLWYPDVVEFARGLLPEKDRGRTLELLAKMDEVVAGFVRGRIVISVIMGVMLAVGWKFCGVPYAITLGLVTGIFCAVPYLGGIGVPIAVGLLFFEWLGQPRDERMAAWLVFAGPIVVFGVVQFIEGYVLTPRIAGRATNLDPVTIIVAVLAGGSILGVYGMLLAIPAAACGKILFMEVLLPRIKLWTKGEVKDPLPIES
ncbi:MAG: AI-2E family transporter [Planctomycetota bacterium]